MIETQRVYDKEQKDGYRILVDRIWPRGIQKEELNADLWLKDIAPSTELRKWFGHDPEKWEEFKRRYFRELDSAPAKGRTLGEKGDITTILNRAKESDITLLYAAKDREHNNAVALKEYLEQTI